ncbi:MAG: OsmC family protein [Flavobacteriales bacterium]
MKTARVSYLGELRTQAQHLGSGTTIITDAPLDNHGKAEAFSPTDLVATSLASCIMTIMGIYCQSNGIEFKAAEASVEKHMATAPRRISKIVIDLDLSGNNWDETTKKKVIAAGKACPVAHTLEGNVDLEINIH